MHAVPCFLWLRGVMGVRRGVCFVWLKGVMKGVMSVVLRGVVGVRGSLGCNGCPSCCGV